MKCAMMLEICIHHIQFLIIEDAEQLLHQSITR